MEKECEGCKQTFSTKYSFQKYCTTKCRDSFRGFTQKCKNCGEEYLGRSGRLFCSARCFGLFHGDKVVLRNMRNRKYPDIDGLTRQQVFWRYNKTCKEKCLKRDRDKRLGVIDHLGGKCVKCGYDKDYRALVLDHKKGDGKKDRKEKGNRLYRYYINHLKEAQEILQILCANCNMIKTFENKEFNISRQIDHEQYKF